MCKHSPKRYLVIERQQHGTVCCYHSLNGTCPLPSATLLSNCFVTTLILVACSPARELPSIALQDSFSKQWGGIIPDHNNRRNSIEVAHTGENCVEPTLDAPFGIGDACGSGGSDIPVPLHHIDLSHVSVPIPREDDEDLGITPLKVSRIPTFLLLRIGPTTKETMLYQDHLFLSDPLPLQVTNLTQPVSLSFIKKKGCK